MRTFSSETQTPATCRVAKPNETLGRQFPTRRWMARTILCLMDNLRRDECFGAAREGQSKEVRLPCSVATAVFHQGLLQKGWWRVPDPFHSGPAQAFYLLPLKAANVADETLSAEQCDRPTLRAERNGRNLTHPLETAPPIVNR